MANILTAAEAAQVLRCAADEALMLALLPSVDAYIRNATGHDWAADTTIHNTAKAAARILITLWHENPAMIGVESSLHHGMRAVLSQLEALALRYRFFEGLPSSGYITITGVKEGDTVEELVGLVNAIGDQSAKFAAFIEFDGLLEQTSSADLEDMYFRALILPLEDQ
jgi:hypothetical protein